MSARARAKTGDFAASDLLPVMRRMAEQPGPVVCKLPLPRSIFEAGPIAQCLGLLGLSVNDYMFAEDVSEDEAFVLVDHHMWVGAAAPVIAVIDHHATSAPPQDFAFIRYPRASTCSLIGLALLVLEQNLPADLVTRLAALLATVVNFDAQDFPPSLENVRWVEADREVFECLCKRAGPQYEPHDVAHVMKSYKKRLEAGLVPLHQVLLNDNKVFAYPSGARMVFASLPVVLRKQIKQMTDAQVVTEFDTFVQTAQPGADIFLALSRARDHRELMIATRHDHAAAAAVAALAFETLDGARWIFEEKEVGAWRLRCLALAVNMSRKIVEPRLRPVLSNADRTKGG